MIKNFHTEINCSCRSSTVWSSGWSLSGLSSSRVSSTRPLIKAKGMFVPCILNNWLILTDCLSVWTVFTRTLFHANFKFKGKRSHRSISICQKQLLLSFCKVVWWCYLDEVWKFYRTFMCWKQNWLHPCFICSFLDNDEVRWGSLQLSPRPLAKFKGPYL